MIKEEIVKNGKNGIAIDCIKPRRLLKTQISIQSSFVTFVVAYVSIEEATEGQSTYYVAVLNSIVALVATRQYIFYLTDANARAVTRSEQGGEDDNKVLAAFGRIVLIEESKILLGCTEGNKVALLKTYLCTPKGSVMSKPSKAPAAARGKSVWTIL